MKFEIIVRQDLVKRSSVKCPPTFKGFVLGIFVLFLCYVKCVTMGICSMRIEFFKGFEVITYNLTVKDSSGAVQR